MSCGGPRRARPIRPRLLADGLSVGSAGNLSVRVGDAVAITPSGIAYHGDDGPPDICLVALAGAQLAGDGDDAASRRRRPRRRRCTWRSTRRPARRRSCTRTRPRSSRSSAARDGAAGHPLRDHRPRRPGPGRALRAVRVGAAGRGRRRGADGPQRGHLAQPRGGHLRRRPGPGLRPGAAPGVAGPHLPAGAVLRANPRCCRRPNSPRSPRRADDAATGCEAARETAPGAARPRRATAREWPLGPVTVLGAHILDVLGRPVEAIPPGQGSARLTEIRATAAGTAAGPGVDLAKLGASVLAVGAIGDDLLGDMVTAAMARHGVDTSGLSPQDRGPDLGHHPADQGKRGAPGPARPGATSLLELADVDLDRVRGSRALLVGAPGRARRHRRRRAGAGGHGRPGRRGAGRRGRAAPRPPAGSGADRRAAGRGGLVPAQRRSAARAHRPRRPHAGHRGRAGARRRRRRRHLRRGRLPGRLARRRRRRCRCPRIKVDVVDTTGCGDGFTAGMLAGLLLGAGPVDAAWLGIACGSLVATGLGSDAGIESLGQALDFLGRAQPAVADRIAAAAARRAHSKRRSGSMTEQPRRAAEHTEDRRLRERARAVIPGGMYGHQSAASLPAAYPQFMRGGRGARIWDVDGNEYVDLMCSYGPVVLGHQHPGVEAGGGGAGGARRLPERSRPGHGRPGRAAGADRAARGLGDVRQERHRRHHHVLHDRPGADRAAEDPGRRRAPTTAPRPGARPGLPASPRRTAPTSATTPITTSPACGRPPPRRATTWRPSWSARSSTTPGTTRSWSIPGSPAACARCATPPGPR